MTISPGSLANAEDVLAEFARNASVANAAQTAANAAVATAAAAMPKVGGTVVATGSTASRTLEDRAADPLSLKDFGATGDGATDDTASVSAAMAATVPYVSSGTYKTTIAASAFAGAFSGAGRVQDANGIMRGKQFSAISSAPSAISNPYSLDTIFNGDYSKQQFAIEHRITGADTLGTPATGFTVNPSCFPLVGYVLNASGHIQNNSTGDGQTGSGFAFLNGEHRGQGNLAVLNVNAQSYGTNPSATGFLAYPSIALLAGQCTAGATGTYLNGIEVHNVDNGFDSAAINYVASLIRSNATGAHNASWSGFLAQSQGSQAADSALLTQGAFRIGVDLTPGTFTNQAAIALQSNHRIYFGAANTGSFSNTTVQGESYITANTGTGGHNNLTMVNGSSQLALFVDHLQSNCPVIAGGEISPLTDNTYTLGDASFRFASLWSVNGTIQTSDPRLKTDIAPVPTALPIVSSIAPVTFKWRTGGFVEQDVLEERDVQETEAVEAETETVEIRDGKPVLVKTTTTTEQPVFDDVPLVDESGAPVMVNVGGKSGPVNMVQKMHRVPRMVRRQVAVKRTVEKPGKRTHWGFLADDVKAAFDAVGADFGGHVIDESGTQHLRPDQLIPVLWKAVQELSAKVSELTDRLDSSPH